MEDRDRAGTLRLAVVCSLTGDVAGLGEIVTEDVLAWAPNLVARSRGELVDALAARDEVLTEVEVAIDELDLLGDKGVVEWRASATFSSPFLVDDDLLIEPNGARLGLAGVTIVEFRGDRIRAMRTYFDDAALLEQMLVEP